LFHWFLFSGPSTLDSIKHFFLHQHHGSFLDSFFSPLCLKISSLLVRFFFWSLFLTPSRYAPIGAGVFLDSIVFPFFPWLLFSHQWWFGKPSSLFLDPSDPLWSRKRGGHMSSSIIVLATLDPPFHLFVALRTVPPQCSLFIMFSHVFLFCFLVFFGGEEISSIFRRV